jgi:deoxyadenosine/deoxycytidine kinase
MAPFIISIEGNIGSGKSTFVEFLRCKCQNVVFLQEPVDEWTLITDKQGESILAKFYKDQDTYSFSFQMMAYISRLALLKKSVEENPNAIIVTERCLLTDREVFAQMLYDDNKIEEVNYQIYLKWFDTFYDDFPISQFVYLRTTPETAYERVLKRNREDETIPLSYLQRCSDYHDNWLMDSKTQARKNVLVLDANNDESYMDEWLSNVKEIFRLARLPSNRSINISAI